MQIIIDFIRANVRYYDEIMFGDQPKYLKEQVLYRMAVCKEDCVKVNKCVYCGCPPKKKAWANKSCNNGERFPNLMNEEEWRQYKKDNNIEL